MAFELKGFAKPVNLSGDYAGLAQTRLAKEMSRAGIAGAVKEWTDMRVQQKQRLELVESQYGMRRQNDIEQNQLDMQRDAMKAGLKQRFEAKEQEDFALSQEYLARAMSDPKTSPLSKLNVRMADTDPGFEGMQRSEIVDALTKRFPQQDPKAIGRQADMLDKPSVARIADIEKVTRLRADMLAKGWSASAVEATLRTLGDFPTRRIDAIADEQTRIQKGLGLFKNSMAEDFGSQIQSAIQGQKSVENMTGPTGAGANVQFQAGEPQRTPMALPGGKAEAPGQVAAGFSGIAAKITRGSQSQATGVAGLVNDPGTFSSFRGNYSFLKEALNGQPLHRIIPGGIEAEEAALKYEINSGSGIDIKPVIVEDNGVPKLYRVDVTKTDDSSTVRPETLRALRKALNKPRNLAFMAGYMAQGGGSFKEMETAGQGSVYFSTGQEPQPAPGADPVEAPPEGLDMYEHLRGYGPR